MAKGESKSSGETPDFTKRKLKVMGAVVAANSADAELSDDTSKDMTKTPGLIAYWSAVHAAAIQEEMQVEARYRKWRAEMELKIVGEGKPGKKGAEVKKPSLDDIKRAVEADPTFLKFKDAQAEAAHNVALAKGEVLAFDKRSNLLQSTGATKRTELEKLGVTTPAEPAKGKRGKAAAKPDPTPDIEEDDEDEDDEDFEEDEDAETSEAADEEDDDEDLEEVDDDEDEEEEKPKKGAKGAKGAKSKPAEDDEDDEDEGEEDDEETDDDEDEETDDEDDEDDEPPPKRAKKAGKKKKAAKKARGKK
jgi:hypothetical protein